MREQARLEQLIEDVKPPMPIGCCSGRFATRPWRVVCASVGPISVICSMRHGRWKQPSRCRSPRSDAMRERRIQAFEVPSARSLETAPVMRVLTPYAFSNTPFDFQERSLEISAAGVIAICFAEGLTAQFTREQFLVAGRWPGP
jgi:hypothetical protein